MFNEEEKTSDNLEEQLEPAPIAESVLEFAECPHCATSKVQAEEYKQGWQRAMADYQNLQKETSERRQMMLEMSEQQILEEFIPVYDNFKKAFAHHPVLQETDETHKLVQNWINGIGHIQRQLAEVMKAHKIEEIKTVGEKFDLKFHEAAGEEDSDGEVGTILREVDGGYRMNGRVIKPAKVIISKSK
ncbi:MAG: nucleotide exchange factor GrpE [Candidatus Magasanikbacteria bacterium]|nr:nucleotide exchange factor GrpE [Candidatus Magasanikbacteria bacterium]